MLISIHDCHSRVVTAKKDIAEKWLRSSGIIVEQDMCRVCCVVCAACVPFAEIYVVCNIYISDEGNNNRRERETGGMAWQQRRRRSTFKGQSTFCRHYYNYVLRVCAPLGVVHK